MTTGMGTRVKIMRNSIFIALLTFLICFPGSIQAAPAPLNARDGGLWLAGMPDLPLLMGTLRLSEKPDPEQKKKFWEGIREAAGHGEPSRVIWLMRFEKKPGAKEKIQPMDTVYPQLDAWFGEADGIKTYPELLLGVVPEEENTQIEALRQVELYLQEKYKVKCYQWLTEPWPPTLNLQADGWIFDAYSDTNEQFFAKLEKFILFGKPVVPILWGSANWENSWGFYRGKTIDQQLAILMQRMEWCRALDLPVIVFAVYGSGSINDWYYGGTDSGKSEEFIAYRDAIVKYLKAMPTAPLPELQAPEKVWQLILNNEGETHAAIAGNSFAVADSTSFDHVRNWLVTAEGLKLLANTGTLKWKLKISSRLDNCKITVHYEARNDAQLTLSGHGDMQLPANKTKVSGELRNIQAEELSLTCGQGFILKELEITGFGKFTREALTLTQDGTTWKLTNNGFADGTFLRTLPPGKLPNALTVAPEGIILRGVAGHASLAKLNQHVALPAGGRILRLTADVQADAPNYGGSLQLSAKAGNKTLSAKTDPKQERQTLMVELPLSASDREAEIEWNLRVGCGVATPRETPVRVINYQVEVLP